MHLVPASERVAIQNRTVTITILEIYGAVQRFEADAHFPFFVDRKAIDRRRIELGVLVSRGKTSLFAKLVLRVTSCQADIQRDFNNFAFDEARNEADKLVVLGHALDDQGCGFVSERFESLLSCRRVAAEAVMLNDFQELPLSGRAKAACA
jgi:hypothetical protein